MERGEKRYIGDEGGLAVYEEGRGVVRGVRRDMWREERKR